MSQQPRFTDRAIRTAGSATRNPNDPSATGRPRSVMV